MQQQFNEMFQQAEKFDLCLNCINILKEEGLIGDLEISIIMKKITIKNINNNLHIVKPFKTSQSVESAMYRVMRALIMNMKISSEIGDI